MICVQLGTLRLFAYSFHHTGEGVFSECLCGKPHCVFCTVFGFWALKKPVRIGIEFLKQEFYGEDVSLVTDDPS